MWCVPAIPALGKQRQNYLPGQAELHSENLPPKIAQSTCEETKRRQTQLGDTLQDSLSNGSQHLKNKNI